jgi:general secretion pathway protein G
MKLRAPDRAGFTLMEIMLVVMIIAILAGMVIYNQGDLFGWAQQAKAKTEFNTLKSYLVAYRGAAGTYPTTAQGLKALVTRPEGDPQPLAYRKIIDQVPKDPWNSDYIYESPGRKHPDSYDIFSAGPDRKGGTPDDVWPD